MLSAGLQAGVGMSGNNSGFGGGMNIQMLDNQTPARVGGGGGGYGQMRDNGMSAGNHPGGFSGLQQLLMAAAAGGMSQDKIANVIQALGFTGRVSSILPL